MALYNIMCSTFGDENHEVREVRSDALSGMSLGQLCLLKDKSGSGRTGAFWATWIQCFTFRGIALFGDGHYRWQPRIPSGKAAGPKSGSVARLLMTELSSSSWQRLIGLGSEHKQLKVFTHHVAYLAHVGILPADLGKGSSIDHLCGQRGCHNPKHLDLAVEHRTNVARINCEGIILLVLQDTYIIQEFPCSHAKSGLDHDKAILDSCRKLRVLRLDDKTVDIVAKADKAKATADAHMDSS